MSDEKKKSDNSLPQNPLEMHEWKNGRSGDSRAGSDGDGQSGAGPSSQSNAGLSGFDQNGNIVNRYSREERLSHAPEETRWITDRYGGKNKPGFFAGFVATKSSRMLLAVLIIAFVFLGIYAHISDGSSKSSGRLAGASFSAEALSYEDSIIVAVRRKGKAKNESGSGLSLRAALNHEYRDAAGALFALGDGESGDYRIALSAAQSPAPAAGAAPALSGSKNGGASASAPAAASGGSTPATPKYVYVELKLGSAKLDLVAPVK